MRNSVPTGNPWGDIVGYARAVRVGNLVFVSGTTASGPEGQALHPGEPGPQTRLILDRIDAALAKLGASLKDVVETRVYVRDIGQTIGIFTLVLLFLSPVFYPADALPENYRFLLFLNPLTSVIGDARRVLIWGQAPDWAGLMLYAAASFGVAWLGFWWFQRTRRGFADVV